MPTHRNKKSPISWKKNRWHKSNNMITTQTNKQTNKQAGKQTNKQVNKQTCIFIVVI